jgi:hypothetical protein
MSDAGHFLFGRFLGSLFCGRVIIGASYRDEGDEGKRNSY